MKQFMKKCALECMEMMSVNSKTVTIYCDGSKIISDRDKEIKEFSKAVAACEGSERTRYAKILSELVSGCDVCSDE